MQPGRIVINGIVFPKNLRRLDHKEATMLREHRMPEEMRQKLRYWFNALLRKDEVFMQEDHPEFDALMQTFKADEKALRKSLHSRVHQHGLWAHTSKRTAAAKDLPALSMMIRPPHVYPEESIEIDRGDRLAPRPKEACFIFHIDEQHTMDGIRTTRKGTEVDRTIAQELFPLKDLLKKEYGNWDVITPQIATIIEGHLEDLRESFMHKHQHDANPFE